MRKRKYQSLWFSLLTLLLILVMVSGSAQAASSKTTYKKGVSYFKAGKYSKAQKYFNKLPANANEACVKKMTSKMKKAYRSVLKKYPAGSSSKRSLFGYYLTDINKDKKAELIVEFGTCEADMRAAVYTYKNGKAKKIGSFHSGHSALCYYPSGNGLMVQCAHMGYEQLYVVKISNGKIKNTALRKARAAKTYMKLPYFLDNHIRWDKNYKPTIDYSPLS